MTRRPLVAGLALVVATACPGALPGARPAWAQVPPGYDAAWTQAIPDGRIDHGLALDPVGRTIYLYGGVNWTLTDDFLAYSLDRTVQPIPWRRLPSAGVPGPARIEGEALAWDTRRGRLLEFGGAGDHPVADSLWVFDPQAPAGWQGVKTQGQSPGAPVFVACVYDSLADALLLYGGERVSGDPTALWTLSFTTDPPTWTSRATGGRSDEARRPGTLLVEKAPHRLLRVANLSADGRDQVQIEALPLDAPGTWAVVDSANDGPRDRVDYPAVLDPIGRRIFVVPGAIDQLDRLDVWEFDLDGGPGGTGWRELPIVDPGLAPHHGHRLAYDVQNQRLLLSGGWWTTPDGQTAYDADVWWFDPATRAAFQPLLGDMAVSPSPRTEPAYAVDRAAHRYYVYGGGGDTYGGDLWSLDFSAAPRWRFESAASPIVPPRLGAAGAFDSRRGRFLVLMGQGAQGALDDVDAWDVATRAWSRLQIAGTPPAARAGLAAVYDSVADRVLLFGGISGTLDPANDLWALELSPAPRWRELHPLTGATPPGRFRASAALDTRRGDWWIYGGETIGADGYAQVLGDAWCLHLAGDGVWRPLDTPDLSPGPRASSAAAYDPRRDRIVYLWGMNASGVRRTETIALTLGGVPHWQLLGLLGIEPYPCEHPTSFWDEANDRMISYAGDDGGPPGGDTWIANWAAPRVTPPAPAAALRARARPNPSTSGTAVEFALGAPARVDCAVYDVAGRKVRTLAAGAYPAGAVTLGWDGRSDGGARVPPGVYWARLAVGVAVQRFQIVLLR